MSSPEAKKLARLRAAVVQLDGDEWLLAADGATLSIDAKGRDGSLLRIATLDARANADETEILSGALSHLRFMFDLLDRCARKVRELAPASPSSPSGDGWRGGAQAANPKNYAAEASMKCQEPGFMAFLEARHGLERPLSAEKAAQKVRSLCGVTSRKELNDNSAAQAAWKQLRGDFEHWRRFG